MWVQALAAPLRARARHVDGMLLCHLLDSLLQVQENRSLENLLGFWCVFQLRAAAVGLSLHLGLGPLAECVKQSYRVVPVANIALYPLLPSFTVITPHIEREHVNPRRLGQGKLFTLFPCRPGGPLC